GASTAIAAGARDERPGVAANPTGNYLVTWSDNNDLHGQLVTSAGGASGAAFPASAAKGIPFAPPAALRWTPHTLVWGDSRGGTHVYGARVSTAGAVLDTRTEGMATVGGVAISTATSNQDVPVIACQASGCLVAWQDRRNINTTGFDVFAQRVNLDFTLAGT